MNTTRSAADRDVQHDLADCEARRHVDQDLDRDVIDGPWTDVLDQQREDDGLTAPDATIAVARRPSGPIATLGPGGGMSRAPGS